MNSRSFRKGHGRSSSDVPFDFNLQQNCETNSIELKTSDKDGLSPWGEMTGKLIKKSIHTVGELARVPTKVLRGSAPITETFNFNFNSNSNSNSNANWSTTVPSDERKSRSGFLGNHSTKGISNNNNNNNNNNKNNNNNNNNNNNFVQNNGNQFKIKEGEFLKPGLSTYPLYSQISAFPENQLEHIPALQTIPIPSFVFSNINFDPKTVAPSLSNNNDEYHCPIFMIVGPDDGIFECINEIPTRRQQLKQMKQNLIINNNNNNNNNNQNYSELSEKEPILMEDLKKKLGGLNKIEKKLKKLQFILNKVQNDKRERTSDSRIYGQSTDSYAYDYIKSTKAGQPNCDSFFAQTFDNNICFCVADGIGWGGASRRAAQSALLGFMIQFNLYLYKSVCKPTKKRYGFNTLNFAKACKESIYLSQLCVYSNSEAKTTMAGGIVAPLFLQSNESDSDPLYHSPNTSCSPSSSEEDEEDDDDDDEITFLEALKQESKKEKKIKKKWVFVGFSVGDSLIYRYSSKNQEVVEVSSSDRSGGMRDAGGNLGGSSPDLSNLQFYCCLVEDGDFLIAVSDGVHDNLDPEVLKLPPHSNSNLTWAELSAADKTKAKKEFKEDKLLEIIEDIEDDNLTSSSISNAVIDYVMRTTSDYREAYELGSKLQRDWGFMDEALRNTTNQIVQQKMKNPVGKFDHVTCLTVKVGFGHPCKFS